MFCRGYHSAFFKPFSDTKKLFSILLSNDEIATRFSSVAQNLGSFDHFLHQRSCYHLRARFGSNEYHHAHLCFRSRFGTESRIAIPTQFGLLAPFSRGDSTLFFCPLGSHFAFRTNSAFPSASCPNFDCYKVKDERINSFASCVIWRVFICVHIVVSEIFQGNCVPQCFKSDQGCFSLVTRVRIARFSLLLTLP